MTTTQPPRPFGRHLHEGTFQSYDEVLAGEQNLVPDFIRDTGVTDIGPTEIPSRWYLDRAVHDLEVERIWKTQHPDWAYCPALRPYSAPIRDDLGQCAKCKLVCKLNNSPNKPAQCGLSHVRWGWTARNGQVMA
ncbi:MAG: hypothetical protein U5N53_22975 [Mycobacterium sp.]|nr:hypothetical protein [Mycobacterium sp.]